MELQISKDLRIVSSDVEFILQKRKVVQAGQFTKEENIGKEVWESIGFHPSVNFALKQISKQIVLDNKDLPVIIEKLNELDNKIEEIRVQLTNSRI